MKKIISITVFFGLLMVFNTSLTAQVEQDHWMLGASSNLSFKSSNLGLPNLGKERSISLATRAGYILKDNFLIGMDLRFSNSTLANNTVRDIKLGPFARYYFPESVFVGLGYSAMNRKIKEDETENTMKGMALSMEVGYPIWVFIERLTLEPTIDYNIGMGNSFKGTNSLTFNLGFMLYF